MIDDPLNDTAALLVIEVMCGLIGGMTPLNPENRPFFLRFFKNGKIESYMVSFTLLLVCIRHSRNLISQLTNYCSDSSYRTFLYLWELQNCR